MEEYSYSVKIQKILDEICIRKMRKRKIKKQLDGCVTDFLEIESQTKEKNNRQQELKELIPWIKQEQENKSMLKDEKDSEVKTLESSIESIKYKLSEINLNEQDKLKERDFKQFEENIQKRILKAVTNIHIHQPSKTTFNIQGVVRNSGQMQVFDIKRTSSDKALSNELWELAFSSSSFRNEWTELADKYLEESSH
ncbi:hypothetical protein ACFFRR_000632 [Megaselia abdita]